MLVRVKDKDMFGSNTMGLVNPAHARTMPIR